MVTSKLTPAPGVLLVAPPLLRDPNFWRSVVLLCEHGEDGTIGLILNRPLTLDLKDVLDGLSGDNLLSLGGPVQQDTLHFLHSHADMVEEAVEVVDGVHWGGDFEAISYLVESRVASPRDLRFFIGYAGWKPGQLEEEISSGGWILARARDELVFSEKPEDLWRATLRRMGGAYAFLANFPADPRVN